MKKFFGKLPVMITFVALAVVMAAAYIGLLVRPAAIGFAYKGEADFFETGKKQEVSMTFRNNKVARTTIQGEEDKVVVDVWVYRDGNYVIQGGIKEVIEADESTKAMLEYAKMSEDDYKDMVKSIEEMKEKDEKAYEEALKEEIEINAFKMTIGEDEFKCTGSVVFAIVGGIVELVLLAGAGLSVFYFIKGKKA